MAFLTKSSLWNRDTSVCRGVASNFALWPEQLYFIQQALLDNTISEPPIHSEYFGHESSMVGERDGKFLALHLD